ncbi:MAG: fluoride efflux transporter CrcB [Bacteroidaceae bacterium]|nr:fluoride efflux transporter CrcB [Bacteroidaceae bacterium]
MIKDIVFVGIGSGIGGICRYLISLSMSHSHGSFPWGTFSVNIVGCLLIGILWGLTSRCQHLAPAFSLLFMVGFCGGFTTFSTFSKEGLMMLQNNNYALFALYILGSVALGIAAVALGYLTTKL